MTDVFNRTYSNRIAHSIGLCCQPEHWSCREVRAEVGLLTPARAIGGAPGGGSSDVLLRQRRTIMTDKTATKPARRFARMRAEQAATDPGSTAAKIADPLPRPESKIAMVTRLLERSEGSSLDEIVASTGWLPHTTRAALTGLKKKGHVIGKAKVDDVTRYSIAKAPAA